MKFEVGDSVVIKHNNEDGKVVEIINDKMVLIEVRGVKFPAYNDQLDFPYFKMFSKQAVVPVKKQPEKKYIDDVKRDKGTSRYKVTDGVWLTFLPVFDKDIFDDDVVESFKLYLVNQTQNGFGFKFWLRYNKGSEDFELKNEIFALNDFYLMDISFESLNDGPSFDFEFSLLKEDKKKAEFYEVFYKPKAKQVFQKIEEVRKQGNATFSHRLFEIYPDRVEVPKEETVDAFAKLRTAGFKVYDAKEARKHIEPAQSVIDLHIEKLHDKPASLSIPEILNLQLTTFEKYLELAEVHHLKEFTVIHGIGTGKLRDEIHDRLRHKKGIKSFVNQYHPWYGYGATQIYLN